MADTTGVKFAFADNMPPARGRGYGSAYDQHFMVARRNPERVVVFEGLTSSQKQAMQRIASAKGKFAGQFEVRARAAADGLFNVYVQAIPA